MSPLALLAPGARRSRALASVLALLLLVAGPAADATVPGPRPGATDPTPGAAPSPSGEYSMPVDAPVVDPFRPPNGPYGPGNRGWELDTTPGQVVVAVGAGTVTFAGAVAGRGVVVVGHPDGLRSSLTGLARIDVAAGRSVARGQPVGVAGESLHLGFRLGEEYLDPALLVGAAPAHAVLVPVPPG